MEPTRDRGALVLLTSKFFLVRILDIIRIFGQKNHTPHLSKKKKKKKKKISLLETQKLSIQNKQITHYCNFLLNPRKNNKIFLWFINM
jgi:hypothetical protein